MGVVPFVYMNSPRLYVRWSLHRFGGKFCDKGDFSGPCSQRIETVDLTFQWRQTVIGVLSVLFWKFKQDFGLPVHFYLQGIFCSLEGFFVWKLNSNCVPQPSFPSMIRTWWHCSSKWENSWYENSWYFVRWGRLKATPKFFSISVQLLSSLKPLLLVMAARVFVIYRIYLKKSTLVVARF